VETKGVEKSEVTVIGTGLFIDIVKKLLAAPRLSPKSCKFEIAGGERTAAMSVVRGSSLAFCWLALFFLAFECESAVHHKSREREDDGAYSPRDSHHHAGDEGQHDSKFDHEAILGSHKDAEDFEKLPPEEAKKRLLVLAGKMDRNLDGFVDKVELHQWILRSFRAMSQEESDERFDENDLDHDDFVDWDEHKENEYDGITEEDEGGFREMDADALDDLAMLYEDKILFKAADGNRDGKLDRNEFFAFSHPEDNLALMREAVIKFTKDTKDKNKDGKIDFQEFVGARGRDQDKDWLVSEKERFDTDLDGNKDGSLDDAEILAWIVPDNENIAKDEVDHLFASADDDHDEKLALDEITKHHEVFVGSEATDYGEHLHNMDRFEDEL